MCAVRRLMRTHLMLNPGTEHFSAPHAVQHVICRKATLADADEQWFSSFLLSVCQLAMAARTVTSLLLVTIDKPMNFTGG